MPSLGAYATIPPCFAGVYAAVTTGGAISPVVAALCGLAAASIEQMVQHCR